MSKIQLTFDLISAVDSFMYMRIWTNRLHNSCLDRQGLHSLANFSHFHLRQILSNVGRVDVSLELANEEEMRVGKECWHNQPQEIKSDDIHDELCNVGDQADHDRPDLVLDGSVDAYSRAKHADGDEANDGRHDAIC